MHNIQILLFEKHFEKTLFISDWFFLCGENP